MACSRAPVGQPEAAVRARAGCRAGLRTGRGTVAEAAAGASSRRRLWAAPGKPRPLPARIDVTDINHTVHASDKFGDFYRYGLRLRARTLEQCVCCLLFRRIVAAHERGGILAAIIPHMAAHERGGVPAAIRTSAASLGAIRAGRTLYIPPIRVVQCDSQCDGNSTR